MDVAKYLIKIKIKPKRGFVSLISLKQNHSLEFLVSYFSYIYKNLRLNRFCNKMWFQKIEFTIYKVE